MHVLTCNVYKWKIACVYVLQLAHGGVSSYNQCNNLYHTGQMKTCKQRAVGETVHVN